MYRSKDYGENWESVNLPSDDLENVWFYFSPIDTNEIWLHATFKSFRSTYGGAKWDKQNFYAFNFIQTPSNKNVYYYTNNYLYNNPQQFQLLPYIISTKIQA